ncbi:hypothetical protein FHG87_006576 [Trinorchestia longiramus]|nr:hypothetical protein FHG87_006576 [Trinorchestia longiramus]
MKIHFYVLVIAILVLGTVLGQRSGFIRGSVRLNRQRLQSGSSDRVISGTVRVRAHRKHRKRYHNHHLRAHRVGYRNG